MLFGVFCACTTIYWMRYMYCVCTDLAPILPRSVDPATGVLTQSVHIPGRKRERQTDIDKETCGHKDREIQGKRDR